MKNMAINKYKIELTFQITLLNKVFKLSQIA